MGQTRTLFIDIHKLDRQGDDAAIVLRRMMACNDLVLANSILGRYKDDQSPSTEYIRRGAGLYLIRVQIAHLYEYFDVIGDIAAATSLQPLINRCPTQVRERFDTLKMYVKGGANRREFEKEFGVIRNATAFHYDQKLVLRALRDRAQRRPSRVHKITTSRDIRRIRFEVADEVIDTLTCRHILKIPTTETMPDAANRFFDSGFQLLRTALDFAVPFVERYIEEFAAE